MDFQDMLNQPRAIADIAHWSNAEYWTFDEAVALIHGREPDVVDVASVEKQTQASPFARAFMNTRELALRTDRMGRGKEKITPAAAIAWAIDMSIPVAPGLAEAVLAAVNKRLASMTIDPSLREAEPDRRFETQSEEVLQRAGPPVMLCGGRPAWTLAAGIDKVARDQRMSPDERNEVLDRLLGDAAWGMLVVRANDGSAVKSDGRSHIHGDRMFVEDFNSWAAHKGYLWRMKETGEFLTEPHTPAIDSLREQEGSVPPVLSRFDPPALTSSQLADAFDGLYKSAERWKKLLGDLERAMGDPGIGHPGERAGSSHMGPRKARPHPSRQAGCRRGADHERIQWAEVAVPMV